MFSSRFVTHVHNNGPLGELPRWAVIVMVAATLTVLLSGRTSPALAGAPGALDPAFGRDGVVTTDFDGAEDEAGGMAVQPDGKLVVAGRTGTDFGLARYRPDGSLDAGFGSGGTVTTDFAAGVDVAHAVAIQPDGKIIAAGTAYQSGNDDIALARYLPDGELDPTFDIDGKVGTDLSGGGDAANAVVIQPDGRIVVAGRTTGTPSGTGGTDFALARYRPDGGLDPTFGTGGTVGTDLAGVFNQAFGVAVQPDGRIVAVGQASTGSSDVALVRYRPDGRMDAGFGTGGSVRTDLGGFDQARAVAIQRDGRIVTAGLTIARGGADFAVLRYLANGRPDPGFDGDGSVRTDFAAGDDEALAVAIQRDGRIVAAGAAGMAGAGGAAGQVDFGLVRYLPNGRPDPGFGTSGRVRTDIAGDFDTANAVLLQPDGKVVAAGRAVVDGSSDVALARYLPGTGCAVASPAVAVS